MERGDLPTADPTALTTAQLLRELVGLRGILEARLDGMDKTHQDLEGHLTRVYDDVGRQVGHLSALVGERIDGASKLVEQRFVGVEQQFSERDIRAKAAELATATGIVVGLQAQKEAAAKSEIAIAEKLNGLSALLDRSLLSLSEKVNDLSSRLDRSEATFNGVALQRNDGRQGTGLLLAACSAMAAVVAILISLYVKHS